MTNLEMSESRMSNLECQIKESFLFVIRNSSFEIARLGIRHFLLVLVSIGACGSFLHAEGSAALSTATSAASYVYKARNMRDPFIAIAFGGSGGDSRASGGSSATKYASVKEIEEALSVDDLILKAVMTDHVRGEPMALLSMVSNPEDSFIVHGFKLKHIATGLVLASYRARVEQENVIIERVQGEPMMAVLSFPSKEGQGKP
ncbi:MAG: hypothetical protein HY547_04295 [Elusimicrobia bacterium]|nr:hypothetical protein [Elusimicrobiota bacterium]